VSIRKPLSLCNVSMKLDSLDFTHITDIAIWSCHSGDMILVNHVRLSRKQDGRQNKEVFKLKKTSIVFLKMFKQILKNVTILALINLIPKIKHLRRCVASFIFSTCGFLIFGIIYYL
jgi:hypothetical protein